MANHSPACPSRIKPVIKQRIDQVEAAMSLRYVSGCLSSWKVGAPARLIRPGKQNVDEENWAESRNLLGD